MPLYQYYCVECQLTFEESFKKPEDITSPCPKCASESDRMISAPNVLKSNTSRESVDIKIGAESEKRWAGIRQRQAEKEKIRKESGTTAVEVKHGKDSSGQITYEYKSVSKERVAERKNLYGEYLSSKKKP
jgi:putative FmdB family regulatory protein